MKKRVSKLTVYLLTIIMVTSIIPVGMTTATAYSIPNESEFINKINELQTRYPANSKYSGYYYENGVQKAASCHGYAFEIAYNVFGSTMYTSGGGWNEIYSLGTIYAGDVIQFYIGSGTHTIFVTKVEGDSIYFTDANWDWNNGIRWNECFSKSYIESKFCKKWRISGNYLTGNGLMPVSNAWISIKGSTIISGEYQTFNFGAENSSGTYTLGIDYEGTRIFTENLKGNSYSTLFTTPGNYSAYITAYGGGGLVDSNKVYFKVVKRVPATNAWIKADKTCIVKTQSITFTYGADDSSGLYTIGIDKDNTRIHTDTISNNTYTFTFNESGQYSVYVTCYGYGGLDDTEKIYITVNDTYQTGDVNCDGVISISDATTLQKYLANIVDFDDEQLAVADTNGDGSVSIADATQIQKYLAQLIPSLG